IFLLFEANLSALTPARWAWRAWYRSTKTGLTVLADLRIGSKSRTASIPRCRGSWTRLDERRLKDHLSPAQFAGRLAFACAATALLGVMAFLALRWLWGAP